MIKTGFYNVVTRLVVCVLPGRCAVFSVCPWSRKEGERRLETELQAIERQERLNRLNIDVKAAMSDIPNSESNSNK